MVLNQRQSCPHYFYRRMKKVHFIAIGGAAMHNLALALAEKGTLVTGSDDHIFEPSLSRLKAAGLLPEKTGWFPEKISPDLDGIVLGMHARKDNPELARARELGLKIWSYPEFLYMSSLEKTRVVVGGSHGKTTVTSMMLHVLKAAGHDFDYMVGAKIPGFEKMVRLSDAPLIVLEGDEYLSSPLDPRPKFHHYHPRYAILTGIGWDHINVFPTFESYLEQFQIFITNMEAGGFLVYCDEDSNLRTLVKSFGSHLNCVPYRAPAFEISGERTHLISADGTSYDLRVFGRHNLLNAEGARVLLGLLGVPDEKFYAAIRTFEGASNRLEPIARSGDTLVFKDFAHAPSKLKATVAAVKEQFPGREVIACMELHTFSSLNKNFLEEYRGALDPADTAFVFFNPEALRLKRMEDLEPGFIKEKFGRKDLVVISESSLLESELLALAGKGKVFLLMSSGDFGGIDLKKLALKLLS
jgi:UDP-N-acetylmuramate: L-alanyl-gamma-D-glutamyl-meso-diaminopimelate ligase